MDTAQKFACFNIARDIARSNWFELSADQVSTLIRRKLIDEKGIQPNDYMIAWTMQTIISYGRN